jgi:hypothetical protein
MTGPTHILAALASLMVAEPIANGISRGHPGLILVQEATPLQIPTPQPAPAAPGTATTPGAAAPDTTVPAPDAAPDGATGAEPPAEDLTQPDPDQPAAGEDEDTSPDELSLGEIPVIETMELTPDIAKRALDSYLVTKEKYANTDLEQYENLQDFVDQTPEGKNFEADIKAAGFANVTDWNLAITTLGVIYGSVIDDQTPDLLQQIKEVEDDTELAQDIKDRMIKALKAMIPSENNKKVVEDLIADAVYGPKLKQLDIEEE